MLFSKEENREEKQKRQDVVELIGNKVFFFIVMCMFYCYSLYIIFITLKLGVFARYFLRESTFYLLYYCDNETP